MDPLTKVPSLVGTVFGHLQPNMLLKEIEGSFEINVHLTRFRALCVVYGHPDVMSLLPDDFPSSPTLADYIGVITGCFSLVRTEPHVNNYHPSPTSHRSVTVDTQSTGTQCDTLSLEVQPQVFTTTECKDDAIVSDFGLVNRSQFAARYQRIRKIVVKSCVNRVKQGIIYPKVCTRKHCTLCFSWYVMSAITPCHKKYGCTLQSCYRGYNSHSTPKALELLRRYHSRKDVFPIHIIKDILKSPESEGCLLDDQEFNEMINTVGSLVERSNKVVMEVRSLTKDIDRDVKFSSDSDDSYGVASEPLFASYPKMRFDPGVITDWRRVPSPAKRGIGNRSTRSTSTKTVKRGRKE